jgi:hypothetical protein
MEEVDVAALVMREAFLVLDEAEIVVYAEDEVGVLDGGCGYCCWSVLQLSMGSPARPSPKIPG